MAKLYEVPGLMTPGQNLTGEIIPPAVGDTTYAARLVPGAEAVPVGSAPQALTETVSGTPIPRRYASVDYTMVESNGRYGVQAKRNSGYNGTIEAKNYKTVGFVGRASNVTAGAANLVMVGGFQLAKNGTSMRVTHGSATASVNASEGEVYVLMARIAEGGATLEVTSNISGASSSGKPATEASGAVTFGTAGYVDAAANNVIYDVILWESRLSDEVAQKVVDSLTEVWAA